MNERERAALQRLGFPVPPGGLGALPTAVRLDGEPVPTWALGNARVRQRGAPGVPRGPSALVCSCGGRTCAHVAAVLLACADLPTEPDWELALSEFAPASRPSAAGPLRCELRRPVPGRAGLDPDLFLGEARAPRAVDLATEAERAVHAGWLAIGHARRLERGAGALVRHLTREWLGPLSHLGRVTLDGEPVRVSGEPVLPRLVAEQDEDGGLTLAWSPALRVVWTDVGVALGADGVVRPLADGFTPERAAALSRRLPPVPARDVRRFVDRVTHELQVAIELPERFDPIRAPTTRSARLLLSEDDDALVIRLQLVYALDGSEVVADEAGSAARIPGAGAVRRDPAWEMQERRRFTLEVGGGGDPEVVLPADAAIQWLRDALPALSQRWEVHGEERLVRLTVRGVASPRVRFDEGVDWFDLDVGFEVDGRKVPPGQILASWTRGERYVRLEDGSLAELPSRWLERHGHATIDLLEVHRVGRKLGSWHAWAASDLLREEGVGERWLRLTGPVRRADPPPGLSADLRPYQREGLDWLRFLRDNGLHGILADEMGLGKTLQALAVVMERAPGDPPSLVVAPTSVLSVWEGEAAKFAPGLRVHVWHGAERGELPDVDVVITTYGLLRRDVAVLTAREWAWAILDEARHVKNPASQTARAARGLIARHRLVLSGTPLENDLVEIWSLFQFLMPGFLGRRSWFHSRYAVAQQRRDQPGAVAALDELHAKIRPFLLRRRKRDVATELPPKTEVTLGVALTARERALYDSVRATVRHHVEDGAGNAILLEGLLRLRQACCHPALLPFPEARGIRSSSKLEALVELLHDARGSRALVFSQWTRMLDQVEAALAEAGFAWLRLDGSTRDRAAVVEAFQREDGPPVLLVSTLAGGTGLTLTAADVVVHLDPWWNPAVEDQATDRAHRIGQTRPVTVYRLVATGTIEERVLALEAHKRSLFDSLVDRGPVELSTLTELLGQA